MKPMTKDEYAFAELCKLFLGFNHIPGQPAGFNPRQDDEVICLDMCLNFPQEMIDVYLSASGQGRGAMRSLRDLAHGVVNYYYHFNRGILHQKNEDKYGRIMKFIRDWQKQFQ